jgi:hypothetical protein
MPLPGSKGAGPSRVRFRTILPGQRPRAKGGEHLPGAKQGYVQVRISPELARRLDQYCQDLRLVQTAAIVTLTERALTEWEREKRAREIENGERAKA